jgi:hypothetical protein
LGFENTNNTMGIQDYIQYVDRADTIQVDVWAGSSSTIRIYGTQSGRSSNHQHDINRSSEGEVEPTNGNGRG